MKALTVWQPWASLIAEGAKPYEFRKWPAPYYVRGQRIAIHAAARPVKMNEVRDLIRILKEENGFGTHLDVRKALDLLIAVAHDQVRLPLSHIVCTARLGVPIKAIDMPGHQADSDRIDHDVYGWPLTEIQPLMPPEAATGAQGFWNWTPSPGALKRHPAVLEARP